MHIVGTPNMTVVRVAVIVSSAGSGSKRCITDTPAPTRNAQTNTC